LGYPHLWKLPYHAYEPLLAISQSLLMTINHYQSPFIIRSLLGFSLNSWGSPMSLAFFQVQDLIQARGGYPPAYDPW